MIGLVADLAWAIGLCMLTFGAVGIGLGIGQIAVFALVSVAEEARMRRKR